MAAFCKLDYQASMVRIESSKDPVATANSVLVRDGIRGDRDQVWRVYAESLQP